MSNKSLPGSAWFMVITLFVAVFFGMATAIAGGVVAGILLLVIVASGIALADYRIGVWFLVLLLPLSATSIFPHQMFGITGANPYNLLMLLTILSFTLHTIFNRRKLSGIGYPRLWWAYITPIIVAAIIGSFHVGQIPGFAIAKEIVHFDSVTGYLRDAIVKPLTYLVVAFLLSQALRDGMRWSFAIAAMCISLWLLAAWIGAYILLGGYGLDILSSSRARSLLTKTGLHANELGALAAFMLTMLIFALARKETSQGMRLLYVLTASISSLLLLFSFSRGGMLAFLVGLAGFFMMQRRLGVFLTGLIALAAIAPLLPPELYSRLSTGLGTGGSMVMHSANDPVTAGRVAGVWLPLIPEFLAHPLLGNGILSVAWSQPFRNGALVIESLNPHNIYLKMLLDVGIVGMILIGLFFVDLRRRFLLAAGDGATQTRLAGIFQGAAMAIVGHAAYGLSGGDFMPHPSNSYVWVMLGFLLATQVAPMKNANGVAGKDGMGRKGQCAS